ncbi:alpha/beta hydrolase [Clavibacter michiganensis]|uniref:alpha/beta hydrolase n=1 Tax=Clavibacter michiganensis TaxID=28447 RepID=UPI0006968008|nr:alpha/beta hydrolase-fold protein [Clavibacter michiganensis]AWF99933.1 esterase [Clavibacter michiganensis subsp. insidiosus]
MLHDLADLPILSASFVTAATLAPFLVLVLGAVVAARARVLTGARAHSPRRAFAENAIAAALGAAAGIALAFVLGDVLDLFGVVLSTGTRGWTALGGTGLALAVLNLVRSRRSLTGVRGVGEPPRRLRLLHTALGILVVPVVVIAFAFGVNADIQQYPTVAAAFGITRIVPLDLSDLPSPDRGAIVNAKPLEDSWRANGSLPAAGRIGSTAIPATQSGFPAREALVYLPPAALVADAPALPVVIALSGQPGSPSDLFTSGRMDEIMDDFAVEHRGLAPIVVVPDQLGSPASNPMCVDSPLGASATYLTVDVPAWIRANLRVASDRTGWAILGFSQGGTCSTQLGSASPDLFGAIVDISGETAPTIGAPTVDEGFGGSQSRYKAAFPAAIMAAQAPYEDMAGFFCVGSDDLQYRPAVEQMEIAARSANMQTRLSESPGTSHDWGTVQWCVRDVLSSLAQRLAITH